jgi:inhibitor of KinA
MVVYDSATIGLEALLSELGRRVVQTSHKPAASQQREIEVCYEGPLAPDLAEVASLTGLTPRQVIERHLAGRYKVYMYGFAPGYAYLGGVPREIQLPRKPAPVRGVPAGSVLIAGPQCIVTTMANPTGWWIIGRSPTQILRPDDNTPFLLGIGDEVRFKRITLAEYEDKAGKPEGGRP